VDFPRGPLWPPLWLLLGARCHAERLERAEEDKDGRDGIVCRLQRAPDVRGTSGLSLTGGSA
jgi:hypothetical protein